MSKSRPIRRGEGYVEQRQRQHGPVWVARWPEGDRWRSKTFADEDDAYDHLRAEARRRRTGQRGPVADLTVAELLAGYLERGRHRWTANTVATYRLLVERHIAPALGSTRAGALTPNDVQRWLDRLTGTLSPSLLGTSRTVLSGAYKEALRLGQVSVNPIAGTRAPARRKVARATWDAAAVRAVLAATAGDPVMHAWYLVALTTGMRPGELRALRWEDIDLERGVVTVRRTITRDERFRQVVGATTKTGRERSVAIPPVTVAALERVRELQDARRAAAPAWAPETYVWDRGNGWPVPQATMHRWHVQACDRAGVARIRMHDLRHVAATHMLRAGVDLKVLSEILGHASLATTADIYVSVAGDLKTDAARRLAEAFGGSENSGENSPTDDGG